MSDSLTVLRARNGRRLAKMVTADDKLLDYDSAYYYDATTLPVAGLPHLLVVLQSLIELPQRCVVRGGLVAGKSAVGIRRLAYQDKLTGDMPTLRETPRRWLALDADSIPRPAELPAEDLLGCADRVISHLPTEFHGAACIVQATASHGIKPGCRLRLWYWCDRPMFGRELNRWLKKYPFDKSIFRPVQPIYTAAPLFAAGRKDHLPYRLSERPGADVLICPSSDALADPPPNPPTPPEKIAFGEQKNKYVRGALIRAANAIVVAGEGNRHETIVLQARSLARLVKAGLLIERDLRQIILEAAKSAGKVDEDEINSCLSWAVQNPSNGKLPEDRHAA